MFFSSSFSDFFILFLHLAAANGLSAISKVLELRLVKEELSYGFTVRGGLKPLHSKSRPLIVTHIRPGGPADRYISGCHHFMIDT